MKRLTAAPEQAVSVNLAPKFSSVPEAILGIRGIIRYRPIGPLRSKETEGPNANDSTAYSQTASAKADAYQDTGPQGLPTASRRLYARVYDDAEEAEFSAPQGRSGEADQRDGGDDLHTRRGARRNNSHTPLLKGPPCDI